MRRRTFVSGVAAAAVMAANHQLAAASLGEPASGLWIDEDFDYGKAVPQGPQLTYEVGRHEKDVLAVRGDFDARVQFWGDYWKAYPQGRGVSDRVLGWMVRDEKCGTMAQESLNGEPVSLFYVRHDWEVTAALTAAFKQPRADGLEFFAPGPKTFGVKGPTSQVTEFMLLHIGGPLGPPSPVWEAGFRERMGQGGELSFEGLYIPDVGLDWFFRHLPRDYSAQ